MLRLPLLPPQQRLVDQTGVPAIVFQQWWQQVVRAIEAQEAAQDVTLNRIRRVLSHTSPTTILHAADIGASCTVTVDAHARIYGDATTVAIAGAALSNLMSDTAYGFYYDDSSLADPTPVIVATTDLAVAQTVAAEGRHFLGVIRTPPAGSGQVRDGGGAYPAGSSIGGELG